MALLVLLLASPLASAGSAPASSTPTYTLVGYVQQPGGSSALPVGIGVSVVLTSSATHQSYSTTTTSSSGQFVFSSTGNAPSLSPGWWGLQVPAQAKVNLPGGVYTILPENQSVQYFYLNASALQNSVPVYLRGVALYLGNTTVNGTVRFNGAPYENGEVQLLAPGYNGFVIASNTSSTNSSHPGYFTLRNVPWGNWILETTIPGVPPYFNYTAVSINSLTKTKTNFTVNPSVLPAKSYLAWGYVDSTASGHPNVPNGGNVTVFDPVTGAIFSNTTSKGGFYAVGVYGSQTFDVILSTVGYETVWYPLSVTPANPTGGANPKNVLAAPQAPPANYTTTLTYAPGFGKLNVSTAANLANDTVFPDLANASVGQLWGQLALDWQHNLSFKSANLPAVYQWINSSGPFFAAGESGATVNGTGYGQPNNYTFGASSTCVTSTCGLSSSAGITLRYGQAYNLTAKVPASLKSYSLSFNFRHPTNAQSFNYTVLLPQGYVLQAGTTVPAQTELVPDGSHGTWTSFTLVSRPSSSPSGTFAFNAVKYGTVTASVNVSSSSFTWSSKNVLNTSRGNYTAIAGLHENLTFTGLNTTFPAGTNGSLYEWDFGDRHWTNTSNVSTNHTYQASGVYSGSLTVISSAGNQSSVPFKIWIGATAPTAVISVNDTTVLKASNNEPYIVVNWSSGWHFNASLSTSSIGVSGAPSGVISVANWNFTDSSSSVFNYTSSSGKPPLGNVSFTSNAQGKYVTAPTVGGVAVTLAKPFYGWQYNVTLTVWDYGGLNATAKMVVLVRDTEKPLPLIVMKLPNGNVVPTAGVVAGPNGTSQVRFFSTNTSDPGNGSVAYYNWSIGNSGNYSANRTISQQAGTSFANPGAFPLWLKPQSKPYTVNLTVTDRAGNKAWTTQSLAVAVNTSNNPVLYARNLTAPTTMTDGSSYTVWVNVTDLFGSNSTALAVSTHFYLLPVSGSGSQVTIGGSPGSVRYYNVTNGSVSSTAWASPVNLKYNHTVRAEISFTPALVGTYNIWANVTCSNEYFVGASTGNLASLKVTFNQNPIIQEEEIAAVVGAAVAVIAILYFVVVRRPSLKGKGGGKGGSSSGSPKLERGASKDDEDDL